MRQTFIVLVFIWLLVFSARPAQACTLDHPAALDLAGAEDINPLGTERLRVTVNAAVKADATGPCQLLLGFDSKAERNGVHRLSGNGAMLSYRITRGPGDERPLQDLPQARAQDLLAIGAAPRRRRIVQYDIVLDRPFTVPPGLYMDRLDISVYDARTRMARRLDLVRVAVRMRVPPSIETRLDAGTGPLPIAGAIHNLDLGILRTGLRQRFSLHIVANTPYDIALDSEGRGRLKTAAIPNAAITYRLDVDGKPVSLAAPVTLSMRKARSSIRQTAHRFTVTIGDVTDAFAGRYHDDIRFTVRAR